MPLIPHEQFTQAMLTLLAETFESVDGYYLDPHDSLFETLEGVTAAQASVPVGGRCATLAAQVRHVAFYLDYTVQSVRDPNTPRADWGHIWTTVSAVDDQEWDVIRTDLRASYERIGQLVRDTPDWTVPQAIEGALGVIAHCAYHLGEIRQALCTLKS